MKVVYPEALEDNKWSYY